DMTPNKRTRGTTRTLQSNIQKQEIGSCPMGHYGLLRLTYLLCQFGIKDLKTLPNQTGCWDVVRNYQVCNFMRDMKEGMVPLTSVNYDTTSKADNPRWSMDVEAARLSVQPLTNTLEFISNIKYVYIKTVHVFAFTV
uniref:Thymocyte nuclear protein 1 n=1 Tax=Hucho hucho TaxID=62062 RepID=A0A4W5QVY8_9TELE